MPQVKKVLSKKIFSSSKKIIVSKGTSRVAVAPSKNIVRAKSRTTSLSVPVYTLSGKASGTMSLPKDVFGAKVNQTLLAQAARVYSANEARLPGSTKKRGEVHGTTAKMYKQKGTGRARHGAKTGLDKATGKTKEVAKLVNSLWSIVNSQDKKTLNYKPSTISFLIVTGEKLENFSRAARNIHGVSVVPVNLINAYEVLRHQVLLLTKEGVEKLK